MAGGGAVGRGRRRDMKPPRDRPFRFAGPPPNQRRRATAPGSVPTSGPASAEPSADHFPFPGVGQVRRSHRLARRFVGSSVLPLPKLAGTGAAGDATGPVSSCRGRRADRHVSAGPTARNEREVTGLDPSIALGAVIAGWSIGASCGGQRRTPTSWALARLPHRRPSADLRLGLTPVASG